jgi:hypothetical protein
MIMLSTMQEFPVLSRASKRETAEADKGELVINGAKVIFDKEVALMPVNLQPKKEKEDGAHSAR